MANAMRRITFACRPSFEKFVRSAAESSFSVALKRWFLGPELEALVELDYPKAGKGRQKPALSAVEGVGLGIMLRIYFM